MFSPAAASASQVLACRRRCVGEREVGAAVRRRHGRCRRSRSRGRAARRSSSPGLRERRRRRAAASRAAASAGSSQVDRTDRVEFAVSATEYGSVTDGWSRPSRCVGRVDASPRRGSGVPRHGAGRRPSRRRRPSRVIGDARGGATARRRGARRPGQQRDVLGGRRPQRGTTACGAAERDAEVRVRPPAAYRSSSTPAICTPVASSSRSGGVVHRHGDLAREDLRQPAGGRSCRARRAR